MYRLKLFIGLFVCLSHSRIFHSYGDVPLKIGVVVFKFCIMSVCEISWLGE